jgi:hypothetical protein
MKKGHGEPKAATVAHAAAAATIVPSPATAALAVEQARQNIDLMSNVCNNNLLLPAAAAFAAEPPATLLPRNPCQQFLYLGNFFAKTARSISKKEEESQAASGLYPDWVR